MESSTQMHNCNIIGWDRWSDNDWNAFSDAREGQSYIHIHIQKQLTEYWKKQNMFETAVGRKSRSISGI